MTTTPDDASPAPAAHITVPKHQHGLLRRVGEGIKEVLADFVGEFIVQTVSCLLLAGIGLGLIWGWSKSPELTLGAVAVLLIGSVTAITAWRSPGPLRVRRIGATLLTVLVVLALWFVLYGSNCGCV
ncbi:hypothetical protein [Streptomyces sp. NPDC059874]|uniref:hypothetical protein n=1 Tax=Streptomyces sp. NPDC059874 TaxID=3346983 RepID=UPI003651AFD2